ncbi:MAG: 4-hydroxy-tetrahydrodipicolinate reductase [Planctomycetaceae bacterium]|nr:4-hydroxy-tetrahydrodipicolinate reductase [Planctomycetaceae bacterium]
MSVRIAFHGAAGRMGQRLVALASADKSFQVVGALESSQHPKQGQDAGALAGVGAIGVPISTSLAGPCDVVIDFSVPKAVPGIVAACLASGTPLVVATTGLEAEETAAVREAAKKIAVLWSPSMSMAVNLAMDLCAKAGAALKDHPTGADVEIIERHHRFKEDSPSGTALKFGQIIAAEMGQEKAVHGREGRPGARPHGEIGYHAVRTGDNPGEHTIVFGLLGETLEITVKATNRDCYAQGALAAAKFLVGKPAGLYSMKDVLGLS